MFPDFIKAANETKYGNELALMLYTGLRVGELRGLQWSDIDFAANTMSIRRQLHPKSQTTKRITAPKYDEERTVYLPQPAINVLKAQRVKQNEQRLVAGAEWIDNEVTHDLVFRMETGVEHGEKTIADAVRNVGSAIGIPALHPHDLRHSYAVAALRSGADVKSVQHNLGHKTSSMTVDIYAAYSEDAGKESAEKLSDYFAN
jgi:integrase